MHIVVQGICVCWHNEGPIKGPPFNPYIRYCCDVLTVSGSVLNLVHMLAERRQSLGQLEV